MNEFEQYGAPMTTGVPPMQAEAPFVEAPEPTDPVLSRRSLLVGAGLVFLSASCGDGDSQPRAAQSTPATPFETGPTYGEGATVAPDETATPYQTSSSTPANGEGSYETSSPEPTPSATETTPNRKKAEIVGHELALKWGNATDPKLAAAIRSKGLAVNPDPSMEGLDESYFNTAVVIGLPAKALKGGRRPGIALVATSETEEYSEKVYKAKLPTGNAKQHGKTVAQLPAAVSSESGQVHPYRFRRGAAELTVVFYTTDKRGKNAKVVDPVILNPKINVDNGTYANAHVI